jgi:hypothetical protein
MLPPLKNLAYQVHAITKCKKNLTYYKRHSLYRVMIVSSNPEAFPISARASPIRPAPTIVQGQSRAVCAVADILLLNRLGLKRRASFENKQIGDAALVCTCGDTGFGAANVAAKNPNDTCQEKQINRSQLDGIFQRVHNL